MPPNAGIAQLVERNLAKVDVAGSNPVSRSVPVTGQGAVGNRAEGPSYIHFLFKVAPPPPIPPGGGVFISGQMPGPTGKIPGVPFF